MKMLKIKKKAVSPVIATILLIALVVAASAVVYFAVIPLLTGNPQLLHEKTTFYDREGNKYVDKMDLSVRNIGSAKTSIEKVEVLKNTELTEWLCPNAPVEVGIGISKVVSIEPLNIERDLIKYGDEIRIKIYYTDLVLTSDITIPAEYSPIIVRYSEDFESYSIGDNLDDTKWTYYHVANHDPIGTISIADWQIVDDDGNKVLQYGPNNCQYAILDAEEHNFRDVNISFSLNANGDDDIMGIIFRFNTDEEGIPRFYMITYSNDHTLTDGRNGPHYDGTMESGKLTLFYVEGHGYPGHPDDPVSQEDRGTLITLHTTQWTRDDNAWYDYTVVASGSTIEIYIDGNLMLQTIDDKLESGYIGLMSGAIQGALFDNIFVWEGV